MSHAWFLYSNEVVTGPFTTEEVQSKFGSGELGAQSFIWWKGQREWIPVQVWRDQLRVILATFNKGQRAIWYLDSGSSPIGPLTQNELIENLRSISDFTQVRVWAVGMKAWKSLYEVNEVMELLGISRREHLRAPLMGTVAVTRSNEDPRGFVAKAASVSVAGIGLSEAFDLRRGDEISILIKSNDIPGNLHIRGEVAYATDEGQAGIRFLTIHPEMHALIHDYVKRFNVEELKAA